MMIVALLGLALSTVAPTQRLGLAMSVPDGSGEDGFFSAIRAQIRMGLDGNATSVKWDELELQNGKPLADAMNLLRFTDQECLLTFATVDTVKRRLPTDLMNKAWDDPATIERFEKFLTEMAPRFDKHVKWVSLGNEVDVYLAQHPEEVNGYLKFLARGRQALKKAHPDLLVGVTVTCMDGLKNRDLIQKLQDGMDATVFTYYPLKDMKVCEMSELPAHFDFMVGVAGSRPLLLQEIGFPAAVETGSSEDKQAAFVKAMFAQLDRYASKISLADYFIQCDFSPGLMKAFEAYYGVSEPTFLAFLRTLGLADEKGKPRKAWDVFRAEVAKRKPLN